MTDRLVIQPRRPWLSGRPKPSPPVMCRECDAQLALTPHAYCSLACMSKSSSRAGRLMMRARRRGAVVVERVDPILVFIRAGWRCQSCDCPTPRWLMGRVREYRKRWTQAREPRPPTIDHHIPIARGGHHTLENVRCLCDRCNRDKGSRLPSPPLTKKETRR